MQRTHSTESLGPDLKRLKLLEEDEEESEPAPPAPIRQRKAATIDQLPSELLTAIFGLLAAPGVGRASRACRRFWALGSDWKIWRDLCIADGMSLSRLPTTSGDPATMHQTALRHRTETRRAWFRGSHRCRRVAAHNLPVTCLHADAEGLVVSGSWDGAVKVWQLMMDEEEAREGEGEDAAAGVGVETPPATPPQWGEWDEGGGVREREANARLRLMRTLQSQGGKIDCLKYHAGLLITGGRGSPSIHIWKLERPSAPTIPPHRPAPLEPPRTLTPSDPHRIPTHVTCLDHDGTQLVTGHVTGIRVWDLATGRCTAVLICPPGTDIVRVELAGAGAVMSILISCIPTVPGIRCSHKVPSGPTGLDLVCGFKDGNLRMWRVHLAPGGATADPPVTLSCLSDWITCTDVDALADVVVAGSWDRRVRIWDAERGCLRRTLRETSPVLCARNTGRDSSDSTEKARNILEAMQGGRTQQ
ncbi:WD40-repeat-containing domain protein [Blyttiomyces helicus]|uniref:WD40-repeat-containing domain protein n=1 Tax=Blyttiomyces helicus TaxID=388810 RepID=A0A4P9WHA2_9FUNG|nr:WD40-repeat-containing domain protein [Blyttiomyces helicus]|eukprot:RKO90450.1 WD40-repeat-containing domain protein [Blyttiomyces helicus]